METFNETLVEDAALDRHTLSLEQVGGVELAIIAFFGSLLGVLLSPVVALLIAAAAVGLLLWARVRPRRATLTLSGGELVLHAQLGMLPIRQRAVCALAGREVSAREGAVLLGQRSWQLCLTGAGEPVVLRGLIGSEAELGRVQSVLAAAIADATARQGEGLAEVPAALRQQLAERQAD